MKNKIGLIFLLGIIILSACSLERKFAKEYIKNQEHKGAILVTQPFALDMFNNNRYKLDSLDIPNDFPLDSLLFQQTYLLKDISDSIFLENYLNKFIQALSKNGYTVFLADSLDAFLSFQGPAYIFRFAQVELKEEIFPYEVNEEFDGEEYSKVFPLTLLTLSSWFEFEARDTAWRKVFFAEDAIIDEIRGEVFYDTEKKMPVLYYDIDSLSMADVYQMATDVGDKYASYLVDYLLNTYVVQNYPKELNAKIFFHYDAEKKMLFPYVEFQGFEELKKEK